MNNLYRELAPVTAQAWEQIEEEATRTFKRHIAGRRVVDVSEPGGPTSAAVSTGHLLDVDSPGDGVVAHLREARPLVRLRVPFTIARADVDDVERGSQDSDWDPVKDAAKKLAFAEDRAIFEGYPAASIEGIRGASSCPKLALPADPREMPDVISQALSELRLAGVDGPYSVLLSADVYTQVSETTVNGYPIREHLNRLVDGDIIWAPAIDGAFVLSTRGGDFDLQLGTDVSIGYLSHDADTVQLYLQETLTFLCYTAEASVALGAEVTALASDDAADTCPWSARERELLTVTIDLLKEHGYDRLTVDGVAAAGRASKATLYRRWPTKAELVLAAFVESTRQVAVAPETGTLRGDLIQLGETVCAHASTHAGTIRAVLVEVSRNEKLNEMMHTQFLDQRKALMEHVLAEAVRRGEIKRSAITDDLFDVMPGYLVYRTVITGRTPSATTVRDLVDNMLLPSLTRGN